MSLLAKVGVDDNIAISREAGQTGNWETVYRILSAVSTDH